jgi:hypothetical protein
MSLGKCLEQEEAKDFDRRGHKKPELLFAEDKSPTELLSGLKFF